MNIYWVFSFVCATQSVHIHCMHKILAHLFSGTFPFIPYSHTLLVFLSLSHSPLLRRRSTLVLPNLALYKVNRRDKR